MNGKVSRQWWCRRLFCGLVLVLGGFVGTSLSHAAPPSQTGDRKSAVDRAGESISPEALGETVDLLASPAYEGREAGTHGGHMAGDYLVNQLRKLPLKPGGDNRLYFQYFRGTFRNVIAVLPGSDPALQQNVILLGAHYDHLGHGSVEAHSDRPTPIYPGADDNASGSAGVLQVARAFTQLPTPPKQTIMFVFFDGEEKGLLGSVHWTTHPTLPLARVKAMVNLDMIGNLRGEHAIIYGTRTSTGLRRFIAERNRATELNLDFCWQIKGDADHYTFFQQNIPSIFLHTGLHERYHQPTDVAATVNRQGMAEMARLTFRLVHDLADGAIEPSFRRASRSEDEPARIRLESYERVAENPGDPPLRLGIGWRSDDGEPGTVVVTGVLAGRAAAASGLRAGDRIYQVNGHDFADDDAFSRLIATPERPMVLLVERAGCFHTLTIPDEARKVAR